MMSRSAQGVAAADARRQAGLLLLACAACVALLAWTPGRALASNSAEPPVPAAGVPAGAQHEASIVTTESGAKVLIEYVDRIQITETGAVVSFDVDGREHTVTVDATQAVSALKSQLSDGKTGLVDLAVIPIVVGAVLRALRFLAGLAHA
ncbi:MAG: hypothetical protein Kow0056_04420 [Coriobacteriia bacterium]